MLSSRSSNTGASSRAAAAALSQSWVLVREPGPGPGPGGAPGRCWGAWATLGVGRPGGGTLPGEDREPKLRRDSTLKDWERAETRREARQVRERGMQLLSRRSVALSQANARTRRSSQCTHPAAHGAKGAAVGVGLRGLWSAAHDTVQRISVVGPRRQVLCRVARTTEHLEGHRRVSRGAGRQKGSVGNTTAHTSRRRADGSPTHPLLRVAVHCGKLRLGAAGSASERQEQPRQGKGEWARSAQPPAGPASQA